MMSLLLMAGLLAAPPDGAGAAYPLFPVLEEAREACAAATTMGAVDPPAAGWVKFEPEPGGWLSEWIEGLSIDRDRYRAILQRRATFDAFRKNAAGRVLILLRTRYAYGLLEQRVAMCEVFDRDARVRADAQALHAWGGGAPDEVDRAESGRFGAVWERPSGIEGVHYVPATEPAEVTRLRLGLIYFRIKNDAADLGEPF